MNEPMSHYDIETLSAFADGELNAVIAARIERHLAECSVCRDSLRGVRELVAAAHALPRDIAAPAEAWDAVRTRVGRVARVARGSPAASRRHTGSWWRSGWMAAAAAIVLVAGTAVLMPRTAGKAKATKVGRPAPVVVSPVAVANVDRSYSATLSELRESLESQRHALSPSTVRIVERSLATIDTAIAEARSALASDPANQALVEILSAHYERKVELLQRATELSSSF
ncbi:MAG: anti-sigma factor [Gemmatimonadaceae bacterium]